MAIIRIDLDDKASAGLEALSEELTKVGTATGELATEAAALTEEQQRQIVVIQQSTSDWKAFAAAVVPALSGVTVEGLRLAAQLFEIAHAGEAMGLALVEHAGKALIDTAASAVQWTVATSGIVSVLHAWRGEATGAGNDSKTLTDRLQALALQTSISTIGFATGFSPAIATARVALIGYEAVLARTGARIDEFGQKTTNLDRAQKAMNDLTSDLTSNLAQGVREIPEYYGRLLGLDKAWQQIDKSVTRANDNYVANLKLLRQMAADMDLVADSTEKFDNYVKRTADDFARLRELTSKWGAEDDLAKKTKAAKDYAEELGKIPKTLNHNLELERSVSDQSLQTVISRIDDEIRKREQAAGAAANAGKFTVEQQKQHDIEMSALRDERKSREQELDALLKSLPEARLRQEAEAQKRNNEAIRAAYDERVKIAEEANQRLMEIENEAAAIRRQTILQARNEFLDDIATRLKLEQDDRKAAIENSKMTAAQKAAAVKQAETQSRLETHALRLEQIREERDQELGLSKARLQDAIRDAKDTTERTNAEHKARLEQMRITAKAERDLSAENSAFNRRELEKQAEDRRQAAADAIKTEQEKAAKLKAMREQVLDKAGFNAKDVLNQADPRAVRNRLAQEAGQKARQQAAADNADLFKEAQFDTRGEAMRQYKRRLAQAQAEAERESRKQFAQGKTDPEQLAQAQANVQKQNLGLFQKQTNVSADMVQTMAEGIQGAAVEQARVDALERQVQQLRQSQQRMTQAGLSAQQRQRAQKGSL